MATARGAHCPFLVGPMNCIGKNMALIAIKLAVAYLIFQYDIRQAGDKTVGGGSVDLEQGRHRESEYQMTDYILGFRDGPVVRLRRRM